MKLGKFVQQPRETRLRRIDYSEWLAEGVTITGVTVDGTEKVSGSADDTASPFQILSEAIMSDVYIIFYATGGADGNTYKATFFVDTSDSQTREDEVLFKIEEV